MDLLRFKNSLYVYPRKLFHRKEIIYYLEVMELAMLDIAVSSEL